MLSRNLEQSLHRAIALAGEHRHEYSTLEHLLLALTEDSDAVAVMKACGVDIERLRLVRRGTHAFDDSRHLRYRPPPILDRSTGRCTTGSSSSHPGTSTRPW